MCVCETTELPSGCPAVVRLWLGREAPRPRPCWPCLPKMSWEPPSGRSARSYLVDTGPTGLQRASSLPRPSLWSLPDLRERRRAEVIITSRYTVSPVLWRVFNQNCTKIAPWPVIVICPYLDMQQSILILSSTKVWGVTSCILFSCY